MRLEPKQLERQGLIVRFATQQLGRDDALLFLNAEDEAIGGTPIQASIASVEGFGQAVAALKVRLSGR